MTDTDVLSGWINAYVRAWNTNDPADIGALFAEQAVYYTAPYRPPWQGREQIIEGWLSRKDEPGETTFTWRTVAVAGDVAVIEGTTAYPSETFSNLWVIRFDEDGRCREFTEWWMEHPS
jgi:uncharacterized protein (TIGR02246 family)